MTDENRQLNFNNPAALDGEGEITPVSSPSRALNSASDTPNASASDAQISKALVPRSPLPIGIASTNGGTNDERSVVPYASEGTQVAPASKNGTGQVQTVARLERIGEASKQVAAVKVQGAQVQVGNVAVGLIRAEEMVAEERKVVHQAIEMTDDGKLTLRHYERTELVFRRHVIEIMYIAALNEPEAAEEPKKKEKCIDCCCQSFSCNFSSMTQTFSRRRNPDAQPAFKKIDFMTPVMRRGRSKGWVLHSEMVFPLVGDSVREIWVTFELLTVIIALILSITTFSLGKNEIFNLLHLVLTILGSFLAIIDGLALLFSCSLYKRCKGSCSHVPETEEKDGETSKNYDIAAKSDKDPEDGQVDSVEQSGCKGRCKECISATRTVFDFIRMIISELIFYPLLMCDIFEMIAGQAFMFENGVDVVSLILFIISTVSLLFYVYILRIIILVVANINSQKKRKPEPVEGKDKNIEFDYKISKSASHFQAYFIFHVIAQMVAQILMIIAIAAKIRDDNRHLFEDDATNSRVVTNSTNSSFLINTDNIDSMDESIHVSGYLWYMLVAGYVVPVLGFLSFFIVMYFWVQEFPIGVCIDMVTVLLMPTLGIDDAVKPEKKDEVTKKMDKIKKYLHYAELKKQFKGLRETQWLDKFAYPFRSPQMVIVCMMYALLQLGFIISAGLINGDEGTEGRPLGGGNWTYFYVCAIIIGYVANMYVFTVALLWITIIVFILAVIAIAISLILFCCLIMACVSSPDNSNNRRR